METKTNSNNNVTVGVDESTPILFKEKGVAATTDGE